VLACYWVQIAFLNAKKTSTEVEVLAYYWFHVAFRKQKKQKKTSTQVEVHTCY